MTLKDLYDLLAQAKQIIGENAEIFLEQVDEDGKVIELSLETWEIRPASIVLKG